MKERSRRLLLLWKDLNSIINRAQMLPDDERKEYSEALIEGAGYILQNPKAPPKKKKKKGVDDMGKDRRQRT